MLPVYAYKGRSGKGKSRATLDIHPPRTSRSTQTPRRGLGITLTNQGVQTAIRAVQNRSRTNTETTRRTVRQGNSSASQDMSTIKAQGGSKMKETVHNAFKMLREGQEDVKYTLKNISLFNSAEQAINIDFTQATGSGTFYAPLHVYDVTSCINTTNSFGSSGTDTVQAYTPASYLVGSTDKTATSPVYYFNPLSGFAQSNVSGTLYTGNTWTIEQAPFAPSKLNNMPGGKSFLKYMKLKMLCVSPSARPCKWTINLCQIKDSVLAPDLEGKTLATEEQQRRSAFYQSLMNKYAFNPIAEQSTKLLRDNFKVLKTVEWITNPQSTTDPDNAGHQKIVDFFYRFDKELDYQWSENSLQTVGWSNDIAINPGVNRNIVAPDKRIYLMIRCLASPATAHDRTIHGSYSIKLSTGHSTTGA